MSKRLDASASSHARHACAGVQPRRAATCATVGLLSTSDAPKPRGAEVACVQNAYNLADRSDQAPLDACAADGVAYVPFFPLGSAFHPDKPVLTAPAVVAMANRLGAPTAYPPSRESRGS
jgi:aryl-alcohol dehydrogenase-like predicted oxidoreductase